MTDAMNVLFTYAQERVVPPLLHQEREYAAARLCAEKQEQAFRTLLDDKARERYDDLLEEQSLLTSIYGRALFRAGFRIALELYTL